ncbi:hypothetical protein Tco_0403860 [Tanacetum coccineum]
MNIWIAVDIERVRDMLWLVEKMKSRISNFNQMGAMMKLDNTIPLEEQDPMLELKKLAKKKRMDIDQTLDFFKSTKRQCASMIHIDMLPEQNDDALYNIQNMFFRFDKDSVVMTMPGLSALS